MSETLPEGWSSIDIRSLFRCWGGMTPSTSKPEYWGGSIPWISSKDIKTATLDRGTEFITRKALSETRLRLCPVGTVLCVVRSGILAHSLPVAVTTGEVVVNQDLKALDSGDANLNEWLALYLRAHEREILAASRKDGTTVQSIRVEELLDRTLPVPSAAEQRRIVEKVETLLEQVNRAKARLDSVPAILKRFRQAVLATACSGGLTDSWRLQHAALATTDTIARRVGARSPRSDQLPELSIPTQWRWATAESLCDVGRPITYGVIKLGPTVVDGIPTLRSSDVRPLFIERDRVKRISRSIADQYSRTYLRGGEVLMTVRGTLGGVATVPADMAGWNISREVAQLPLREGLVPQFVM
jgi:type I restriction enzyme S subunit